MNHSSLPIKTSTRLVRLLPGSPVAPIQASLVVIDLAGPHPEYEAVSYCWGQKSTEYDIEIDGQMVPIWENLYQCLLRLRSQTSDRLFWIDALSISQNDLVEKSQQVQIISDIFQQAVRILAWVGEHSNGSEELFQPSPDTLVQSSLLDHVKHKFGGSKEQKTQFLTRAKQWCHFFRRPYFCRTWIVQEILLAKSILVHCGSDSLDWSELITSRMRRKTYFDGLAVSTAMLPRLSDSFELHHEKHIDSLTSLRDALDTLFGIMRPIRVLQEFLNGEYYELVEGKKRVFDYNLLGIVSVFSYTACTEQMDRVYAIRSLEKPKPDYLPLPVDYTAGMKGLVVSVFEQRYVRPTSSPMLSKRKAGGEDYLDTVRQAQTMIYALRMDRQLCQQVADGMVEKIRNESDEELKRRWNEILDRFRSAAYNVARLAKWEEMGTRDGRALPVVGQDGEKFKWE